jgi:hypothetical protein
MIEVRANTQGFAQDIEAMRGTFDASLVSGFERAGGELERGLLSALRRGSLGFDDLKRSALASLDQIAAGALRLGLDSLFGGSGGVGGLLGGFASALFGLPGRATGGPVAPGNAYVVGERGPEVFVPTSAGRIETGTPGSREVRVAIQLNTPRGTAAPVALRRSARQVASSVRRALEG